MWRVVRVRVPPVVSDDTDPVLVAATVSAVEQVVLEVPDIGDDIGVEVETVSYQMRRDCPVLNMVVWLSLRRGWQPGQIDRMFTTFGLLLPDLFLPAPSEFTIGHLPSEDDRTLVSVTVDTEFCPTTGPASSSGDISDRRVEG